MSEKRWLIRTKSKQILGPASKKKIISLLEKNSLTKDDELSSGNGYWFWVREKDLVDKYLYNETKQGFNPISEAETKLGAYVVEEQPPEPISIPELETGQASEATPSFSPSPKEVVSPNQAGPEEPLFPSEDDLQFPEVVPIEPQDLALSSLKIESTESESDESGEESDDTVADIAEMLKPAVNTSEEDDEDEDEGSEPLIELERPSKKENKSKRSNDRYLLILLLLLIFTLAGVFYYYRTVLGKPIPIIGMSDAHAQDLNSLVKKKQLLS